jgi:uracil-DNA glycosylase
MTTLSSRLEKNWHAIISGEFETGVEFEQHMTKLEQFLQREKDAGRTIYPKDEEIFNALNFTAFKKIKVVIIGQDPYHGEGQAQGLCFSVHRRIKTIPPSLRNIYEEIKRVCCVQMPDHGDLTGWPAQGVLLLNATLTVRKGRARLHKGKGWEEFTDAIIRAISKRREPVVFLLWGSDAQKKRTLIGEKHLVLEASHPSPRSAHRSSRDGEIHSFRCCGHFKKANDYLMKHGLKPVDWQKI